MSQQRLCRTTQPEPGSSRPPLHCAPPLSAGAVWDAVAVPAVGRGQGCASGVGGHCPCHHQRWGAQPHA